MLCLDRVIGLRREHLFGTGRLEERGGETIQELLQMWRGDVVESPLLLVSPLTSV